MLHTHSLYKPEMLDLDDLSQPHEVKPTILACLHEETMLMVMYTTFPGYATPLHTHAHEQIGMVLSGKAIMRIGDSKFIVKAGDFYTIPPNTLHSDKSFGDDPFLVMVFYPAGEKYIWQSEESDFE